MNEGRRKEGREGRRKGERKEGRERGREAGSGEGKNGGEGEGGRTEGRNNGKVKFHTIFSSPPSRFFFHFSVIKMIRKSTMASMMMPITGHSGPKGSEKNIRASLNTTVPV